MPFGLLLTYLLRAIRRGCTPKIYGAKRYEARQAPSAPAPAQTNTQWRLIKTRFPSQRLILHPLHRGGTGTGDRRVLSSPFQRMEGGIMAEPSYEELRARVAELEKQKGGRKGGALEFRVGEKGGVSVYGLGRFPVTLYYEQWARLLDAAGDLRTFLEENKAGGKLKLKDK